MITDDPVRSELEIARRAAFVLDTARRALLMPEKPADLDDYLDAILQGAMENPTAITPEQFTIAYVLRGAGHAGS